MPGCYASRAPSYGQSLRAPAARPDGVEGPGPARAEALRLLRGDDRPEGTAKRGNTYALARSGLSRSPRSSLVAAIGVGAASRPHSVEFSSRRRSSVELAAPGLTRARRGFGPGYRFGALSRSGLARLDAGIPRRGRKSRLPWGVQVVLMLLPLMVLAFLSLRRGASLRTATARRRAYLPVTPASGHGQYGGGRRRRLYPRLPRPWPSSASWSPPSYSVETRPVAVSEARSSQESSSRRFWTRASEPC